MFRALSKAHGIAMPADALYDELVTLYATARRAGHTWETVWHSLRADLPAQTRSLAAVCRWRLQHLPEPHVASYPSEPCGHCDGRAHEPATTRLVWIDAHTTRPCRACHPQGIAQARADEQRSAS